jgi:hypothetical protein
VWHYSSMCEGQSECDITVACVRDRVSVALTVACMRDRELKFFR